MISFDNCRLHYNQIYRTCQTAPMMHVPYDRLQNQYTKEPMLEAYPYMKGYLFAAHLQSHANENKQRDLHSWFNDAYAKAMATSPWTQKKLLQSLQAQFGNAIEDWHRFIAEPQELPIVSYLNGQAVQHNQQVIDAPDFGVDLDQLYLNHIVWGNLRSQVQDQVLPAHSVVDRVQLPSQPWGAVQIEYQHDGKQASLELTPQKRQVSIAQVAP